MRCHCDALRCEPVVYEDQLWSQNGPFLVKGVSARLVQTLDAVDIRHKIQEILPIDGASGARCEEPKFRPRGSVILPRHG